MTTQSPRAHLEQLIAEMRACVERAEASDLAGLGLRNIQPDASAADVARWSAALALVLGPPLGQAHPQESAVYYSHAVDLVCDELGKLKPETFEARRDKIIATLRNAARWFNPLVGPQPEEWRLIETLKGDYWYGRAILVWVPENRCTFMVSMGGSGVLNDWYSGGVQMRFRHKPSHWRPIPDPPVALGHAGSVPPDKETV